MHHRSGSKGKGSDPNSQKSSTHNSNVFSASELPKTGSINIRKQDSKAAINRSSFLAASSVEFSKRKDSSKKNSQELLSEDRKRPISILSMKQINQLKAASRSNSVFKSGTTNSNTDILARQETAKREQPPVAQPEQNQVSPEYADYLMLQQRFDSSDFIHKIESADAVWERKQKKLKIIGTFLLGDKIGRGAFAHVKEGLDSETLARVAVKIIKKNRIKKMPNGIEGVTREILLLRRLRHQNVIRLLDVYAKVEDNDGNTCVLPWFETIEQEPVFWIYDDGTEQAKDVRLNKWYIVFEFCPCSLQTLLDAAEGNKLPINEAHRYFVQLMDGLQYLHNQSVVHRDIKPANMLITNDGVLKITDFGVAEQFSQYSAEPMKTEVFAGTHQFLAPEVVDGLDICDGAPIDVWACGVTLYYMITGRLPFDSKKDGYMDLYEQISKGSYQKPAEADADLQELIRNMLEKDPTKRFTVAEIQSTFWVKAYHPQARDLPKILAYRPSQVGEDGKEDKNSPLSVPCETTMIPFLNQMYEKDIRTHLEKCGTVSTWISEEDISPTSQTVNCKKFIGWIKNVMHQK
ncbi:kinase-like domain-containing protein [Gorgonomyces haynaldii]|nr:kinase-like domain-containing protein [Gorgonomyces haynaldii]